jgi:hypothetical protein
MKRPDSLQSVNRDAALGSDAKRRRSRSEPTHCPGERVLREPVGPRVERLIQTYGLFHPNNFGAAIMADAYLKKMNCILDRECSVDDEQ